MKLMKPLAILITFTLPLSVFARNEFVKFSELEEQTAADYSQAEAAQFKVQFAEGPRCTGMFISNEGHGLTAAHCIKKCMPYLGVEGLQRWPVEALNYHGEESTQNLIAEKWSYPQLCEAVIDGVVKQVKLLAGSKGRHAEPLPIDIVFHHKQYYFITQSEVDSYKSLWLSSFYDGWGMGGDFAIFQIVGEEARKTSCLQISETDTFQGNHYTLSYPYRTSIGTDEVNHDLYLSSGDIHDGNYFESEVVRIENTDGRYLNSDIRAYQASSGAGLVDFKTHQIVGVLSAVVGYHGMTSGDLPNSRFVSSKVIREQAGDLINQLSCETD